MEIKEHEQIILNDFKAQEQSILSNIRIANKELEKALGLKTIAQESSKSLDKEIKNKTLEIESLDKDIESKKAYIKIREESITLGEERIRKEQLKLEEDTFKKLELIKNRERTEEKLILEKKEFLNKIIKEVSIKEKELLKLNDNVNNIKESILNLELNNYSLRDESILISKNIDNLSKEYIIIKSKLDKELKDLQTEVKKEEEKTLIPRETLSFKEDEIKKRERNLQTLIARYKKEFKKLHPNEEPNI